jgi:hypothetical protein
MTKITLAQSVFLKGIGILIIAFTIWGNIEFYKAYIAPVKVRCGIVFDKTEHLAYSGKSHNAYYEQILFVQYNDNNAIERIDVTADTYYKNNKGDRVCFDQRVDPGFMIFVFAPISLIDLGLSLYLIVNGWCFIWWFLGDRRKTFKEYMN